jgi:hypothetical protein
VREERSYYADALIDCVPILLADVPLETDELEAFLDAREEVAS